jgi:acyl dehydratase
MAKYLEDFREGEVWQSGSIVIGEDEMIAYAKANDPQPIHVDPDAARKGPFGGIIASGWQIAALSMRLFVEAGGHGDTPIVGIGIDELRWKQVVRPGDASAPPERSSRCAGPRPSPIAERSALA